MGIGASDTSLSIADATGWPDGTNGPFTVTIKRGQSGEEKILVTSRSGTTLSPVTRGYEGTTAVAHSAPETVEHTLSKTDVDEANAHINVPTQDNHTQYAFVSKTLAALRGAAGRSMKLHYGTDSGLLSVDDGTTWHEYQTKQAADAAYAPAGSPGITQAAADLRYLRLSTGGASQTLQNQLLLNQGAIVYPPNTASNALLVSGLPSQSADVFGCGDQFGAFTLTVGNTGRLKWNQAASYGHLVTNVGAGGTASAMPTPAKYLYVTVDSVDYRIALFN